MNTQILGKKVTIKGKVFLILDHSNPFSQTPQGYARLFPLFGTDPVARLEKISREALLQAINYGLDAQIETVTTEDIRARDKAVDAWGATW